MSASTVLMSRPAGRRIVRVLEACGKARTLN
jgi:hypothetical protein